MRATWLAHSTFGTIPFIVLSLSGGLADYALVVLVIPKGELAGPQSLNWQIMFHFTDSCCLTCVA